MALPKLNTPTYELELPSTSEIIKYRPFLVKEQKILLIAQESGEDKEIARAMSDLVNSCTFGKIDGKTAALFDVEYIFLQIRGKSVGETVELNVLCPDDGETSVSVKLAIDDINITMLENHTNEIMIQDDVKIVFRYPILSDMEGMLSSKSNVETVYQLINRCIQSIHYGDDVYNKVDITEKDVDEFVDQLTGDQFELLVDFFDTMPKLRHVIKVTNPKTKKKNEVVLEGLQSFLG
jgi:hypothetical protein